MNKIPICHYVAFNNPKGAKTILQAWGVPIKGGSKKFLADSLQALLGQEGEPVLMDLANLHPDKELILKVEEIKAENNNVGSEKVSSCNGDTACAKCSEKQSNACGCGSMMSGFGGGSWNHNEGAYYTFPRNPWVDEFQVYGFNGSKSESSTANNKGAILFGGVAIALAYLLYKNS